MSGNNLSKTVEMTEKYDDFEIIGLLINKSVIEETKLERSGLNRVINCVTPNLNEYFTIEYTKIFTEVIQNEQPEIVFIGATNQGRDLAPRVAARLKTGLTADCTELEIFDDGKLLATRPTFGGSLMAQIRTRTVPQMATVRPNTFKIKQNATKNNFSIKTIEYNDVSKVKNLNKIEKNEDVCNFSNAKIILSGGMGLKNKENFDKLKQLAQKIGAEVGATRKAVEKGLIEKKYQVGQTGTTVAPEIYFAIGISGAIQHTSGIENANTIIAVNPDMNAQIHKFADYSIYIDGQSFINNWLNQH